MHNDLPHPVEMTAPAQDAPDRLVLAGVTRCVDPRWHFRLAVPRDWRLGPQGEVPPAADDEAILALFKTRDPDADLEVTGRWMPFEVDPADWLERTLEVEGRAIASTRHVRLLAGVVGDAVATWEAGGRAFAGRFFATKWGPRLFLIALRTPREHYARFAADFFTAMATFKALDDSLGLFSERVRTVSGERPVSFQWVLPVSWDVEASGAADAGRAAFDARPLGPGADFDGRLALAVLARGRDERAEGVGGRFVDTLREAGVEVPGGAFSPETPREGFLESLRLRSPARQDGRPAELFSRVMGHPSAWFVGGAVGPVRGEDPSGWMRTKRALDIATGTLEIRTPPPPPDWWWYVVEHAFVVRFDAATARAERLHRAGVWVPFHDLPDITMNGRQLDSEEAAMEIAARLFEMYPELP